MLTKNPWDVESITGIFFKSNIFTQSKTTFFVKFPELSPKKMLNQISTFLGKVFDVYIS